MFTGMTRSWLPWHDVFYALLNLLSKELYALDSPDHQPRPKASKPQHECLLEQLYAIDVPTLGPLVGQEIGVSASRESKLVRCALTSTWHYRLLLVMQRCISTLSPLRNFRLLFLIRTESAKFPIMCVILLFINSYL